MKTNLSVNIFAGMALDLDLLGTVAAETWMSHSQDEAGSVDGDPQPVNMFFFEV